MNKKTSSKNSKRWIPIGLVFNVSTLAASVCVLVELASGNDNIMYLFFRAMVVFIGLAIAGCILMVALLAVIHQTKQAQLNQQMQLAHEERLASLLGVASGAPDQSREPTPTSEQLST